MNNQITAPELRVIDEQGGNLGVMPLSEALKIAGDKNLDLIEIVPGAKPPIAKIISFDKFRYQKEKELKKQKTSQKTSELKQIQISARAAQNDMEIKARQLEKFLNEGHKIGIVLVLRGREKYNRDWGRQRLDEFLKLISAEYKITAEPKFGGRGIMMQIANK
ncbi:translation initiation factor IF-3 [Candidatus Wolfebacteria bacterium RIFCSPLOWO2_01_FULL_38_11]|uniref:Translation initiation factor IF-3 n=2 Tax=Candidatus Wolfeibacteriota TaxID=1752735 RepID=A0A1F8DPG6_9BACT|nr:MAG: translation initiation factor IF-3 [Candidatus Wolfebacteria bacterium RIFCSPLOWO2_01_FULL_38_11]